MCQCRYFVRGGHGTSDNKTLHATRMRRRDCQEWCTFKDVSHPRGPRLQGYPAPRLPPPECSHELPMFVRVHMHMGMCVYARLRWKYIFVLSNRTKFAGTIPPLVCSVCLNDLQVRVRMRMRVGVCGYACACARA